MGHAEGARGAVGHARYGERRGTEDADGQHGAGQRNTGPTGST
jgi:hypothetical protein